VPCVPPSAASRGRRWDRNHHGGVRNWSLARADTFSRDVSRRSATSAGCRGTSAPAA
jgi:hypothetical protein